MSKTRTRKRALSAPTPIPLDDELASTPVKPKSKKKRKKRDRAFNPRGHSGRGGGTGNMAMRTDNNYEIIDGETGESRPLKTSCLIHEDALTLSPEVSAFLSPVARKYIQNVRSYRPIKEITETSENGTPLKVITPGDTILPRTDSCGSMSFFKEQVEVKSPATILTFDSKDARYQEFIQSEQYQKIKTALDNIKLQEVKITKKLLDKTKREHEAAGRVRVISQNGVMVNEGYSAKDGSATKYAEHLFPNLKWQWLHLVAHLILGKISQNDANLVCGTDFANTDMMTIEAKIKTLAEAYKEGFTLKVVAELIPGTQIATTIKYFIVTKDLKLPFIFNAQSDVKPHDAQGKYVSAFIDSLLHCRDAEKCKADKENQPPREGISLLFRKKSKSLAKSAAKPAAESDEKSSTESSVAVPRK